MYRRQDVQWWDQGRHSFPQVVVSSTVDTAVLPPQEVENQKGATAYVGAEKEGPTQIGTHAATQSARHEEGEDQEQSDQPARHEEISRVQGAHTTVKQRTEVLSMQAMGKHVS